MKKILIIHLSMLIIIVMSDLSSTQTNITAPDKEGKEKKEFGINDRSLNTINIGGIKFVKIPSGDFMMGPSEDCAI